MNRIAHDPAPNPLTRAKALRAGLHDLPVAIQDAADLVVVFELEPDFPRIISPEARAFALSLIGGRRLIERANRYPIDPGRCLVVLVLLDDHIVLSDIGLRRLAPGGDA